MLVGRAVLVVVVFEGFEQLVEGEDEVVVVQAVVDGGAFFAGADQVQVQELAQVL